MSTLPVLVSTLAEVDGRDRATIEYFGRTIREAGYIATGKRGMGAPKMTVREAGNLLLALNGSDGPKDAPIAIDRYRSLRQFMVGDARTLREYAEKAEHAPGPIQDAMDARTFGEALDCLVEGAPELLRWFFSMFKEDYPRLNKDAFGSYIRLGTFGLLVTLKRYGAEIEVFRYVGSLREVEYSISFTVDTERFMDGFYGTFSGDRQVSVSFGLLTLLAAWRGLNPDCDIFSSVMAEG